MSEVVHGRANHDPISRSPECLCGAKGIKDTMWDRYFCPCNGVWLEGIHTACWCPDCLVKIKRLEAEIGNEPYDPERPYDGHDYQTDPVNEW